MSQTALIESSRARRRMAAIARWIISMILWAIIGVVLIVMLAGAFTILAGSSLLLIIFTIMLILTMALAGQVVRRARLKRAEVVFDYIEQSVRAKLPLPAMLAAAERSEDRRTARRLAELRDLLTRGAPLADSLEIAFGQLPRRKISILRGGERIGRLAPALDRLVRRRKISVAADASYLPDATPLAWYRVYPLVVLAAVAGVSAILMVFVMPKFEQIMFDFGIEAPAVTLAMLRLARAFGLPLLSILGVLLLVAIARSVANLFHGEPAPFDLGLRNITDRLLWHTPIAHGIQRDRGMADACALLADATEAGMPLPQAMRETSALRLNATLRDRLAQCASEMTQGSSPADAARSAALPKLFAAMLANAAHAADVPSVMRFLERYYHTRFSRTLIVLEAAIVPLTVFALAAAVAFVALSMFMPIVRLIDQVTLLSGYW